MAAPCRTAVTPLPGGDLVDIPAGLATAHLKHGNVSSGTMSHLVAASHGSRYRRVLELAAGKAEARACCGRFAGDCRRARMGGQARNGASLNDAVELRRTPLGALGYPGDAAAHCAAGIVGSELGWSE